MKRVISLLMICITLFLNLSYAQMVGQEMSNGPDPKVFALAERAWNKAHQLDPTLRPILTIVDFSKSDLQDRFWVIDLRTHTILYTTLVAHGVNSGGEFASSFSNQSGSLKSSIGVFKTLDTYYGHAGYSLKIQGLEPGWNDNVLSRSIIVHGADYVNYGHVGHSWGCFALSRSVVTEIIDTIKHNTLIFAYYPDQHYLSTSKFLNG